MFSTDPKYINIYKIRERQAKKTKENNEVKLNRLINTYMCRQSVRRAHTHKAKAMTQAEIFWWRTTENLRLSHCLVWRFAGPRSGLSSWSDALPQGHLVFDSLISPIYWLGQALFIILFPVKTARQNHTFLWIVNKGRPQKIPFFRTLLLCPHVAYPSACECLRLALDTGLWSGSVMHVDVAL